MKISPITSCQTRDIKNTFIKQNYQTPVIKNNTADSFTFTGKHICLSGRLSEINDNEFPDDLYLDLDEVFDTFENEERVYHRWENFRAVLGELAAKRCNHLGLTQCAEYDGWSSSLGYHYGYPRSEEIDVSEYDKDENNISINLDWTREFHELDDFFKGTHGKTIGAEHDMDKIRKGLPEILRKQGWIK